MGRRLATALAPVLLLALGACGSAPPRQEASAAASAAAALPDVLTGQGSPYVAACERRTKTQAEAVGEARWIPPSLRTRELGGEGSFEPITLEALADRVVRGDYPEAMVEARGGLGKTKLLDALEAATCGRLPTFRLDANSDLPTDPTAATIETAIRARVAKGAGFDGGAGDARVLPLLRAGALLLVDSLDEVPLDRRASLTRAVNAVRSAAGERLRLVMFMRPPVFTTSVESFGIRRVVEIEALDCDAAHERVRTLSGDAATEKSFWEFAGTVGLDRQRKGKSCRYVHLATYRDVETAITAAREANWRAPEGALTRAAFYEKFVAASVFHALRLSGPDNPADPMGFLDALVDAQSPDEKTRGLDFTKPHCLKVAEAWGGRAEATCDAVFTGPLFRRVEGRNAWTLRNQSVADLLLARWADRKIREPGRPTCGRIQELSQLFESSEVVSFLVGLPGGSACIGPILETMCKAGGWPLQTAILVDQGLDDAGRDRLGKTVAALPESPTSRCVKMIAENLAQ